jgi:hypothetical protein
VLEKWSSKELIGGKDPMLVKVKTDELISFGDR